MLAIVETGATYSFLNGKRAKSISLDLMSGKSILLGELSGNLNARLHRVTPQILGSSFECEVASGEWDMKRELLGRHELVTRVRFGFREELSLGYFHPQP